MQTTKAKILSLLKRRGRLAVDILSDELNLAPMTVRQHLTSLERDRLVEAVPERQPKGRPHYIYGLTAQGEESFHKRYDWLTAEVFTEIGAMDPLELTGLGPSERTEYIIARLADRVAAPHLSRLRSMDLEDRVREAVSILQRESGFVECNDTSELYEIIDFNCMYRAVTRETSDLCAWHRHFVSLLLGVSPDPSAATGEGFRCRFAVRKFSGVEAGARRSPAAQADLVLLSSQEVHR
jgi:predicted ArsR family transcriptional regulator